MSVVPLETRDRVVEERRRVDYSSVAPLAVTKPVTTAEPVVTVPRNPGRQKARSNVLTRVVDRGIVFGVVAFLAYSGSNLMGNAFVERARQDAISARKQTLIAQKSEASLRAKVNDLTSIDRVSDWATAHGMVTADGLDAKSEGNGHGHAAH